MIAAEVGSILVVGRSQPVAGAPPLKGPTGSRLFRLAGRPDLQRWCRGAWEVPQFPPYVTAVNFFDVPAEDDTERVVTIRQAIPTLEAYYQVATGGVAKGGVVLLALGGVVARRLGLTHAHLLKLGRAPAGFDHLAGACYVPHPSGSNRWWNDPDHLRRGAAFLRSIFRASEAQELTRQLREARAS